MRWIRFRAGERTGHAVLDDLGVHPVDGAPWNEPKTNGELLTLDQVELLPPVVPPTFYAVGYNYADHVRHVAELMGTEPKLPTRPEVGYRAANALTGHGQPVVRPADFTGLLEAEGELVAVIGRQLRRCSREEARAGVFGWTIGNDVSAREWQRGDRTFWRAKNSDTFKPMGPWIETEVDPMASTTSVTVNGITAAEFATGGMIFDPYDYIVETSRYITLYPGDVLWMGADATVAMNVGDTLSVSISGIGVLSNPVVQEEPPPAAEENP
jgi:2-keto-4-pentenoate hydratase/2-oxohepta-3-ene-1,7-dioic acid hydratase in catechol pathway